MKCIILAAGYSTRLYPLTLNIPKALIKVNNKHLIDYIIDKVKNIKGIILIKHDKNLGKGAAIKSALKIAKGNIFIIQGLIDKIRYNSAIIFA